MSEARGHKEPLKLPRVGPRKLRCCSPPSPISQGLLQAKGQVLGSRPAYLPTPGWTSAGHPFYPGIGDLGPPEGRDGGAGRGPGLCSLGAGVHISWRGGRRGTLRLLAGGVRGPVPSRSWKRVRAGGGGRGTPEGAATAPARGARCRGWGGESAPAALPAHPARGRARGRREALGEARQPPALFRSAGSAPPPRAPAGSLAPFPWAAG